MTSSIYWWHHQLYFSYSLTEFLDRDRLHHYYLVHRCDWSMEYIHLHHPPHQGPSRHYLNLALFRDRKAWINGYSSSLMTCSSIGHDLLFGNSSLSDSAHHLQKKASIDLLCKPMPVRRLHLPILILSSSYKLRGQNLPWTGSLTQFVSQNSLHLRIRAA